MDVLKNYLTFESSIDDDGVWNENGDVQQPPGLQHSLYLAAGLAKSFQVIRGPWNEEDYGWEFLCKVNRTSVSVLIAPVEGRSCWLVIVIAVDLLGFLRRQKVALCQQQLSDAIERLLKADDRFRQIQRYSQAESDDTGGKGHL